MTGSPKELRDRKVIEELQTENLHLREENIHLRNENLRKDGEIAILKEKIEELTVSAGMNSSNSSKPPSSDGYHKPNPRSLREKTGKRPGGQPGHKGHNIVLPHDPDECIDHLPDKCRNCHMVNECMKNSAFRCKESRYVIDAVTITKVTEHRMMSVECPLCDQENGEQMMTGSFPDDVKSTIQYGNSFAALVNLFDSYGFMSDSRTSRVMRDIFDVTLSEGTVVSMTSKCAEKVAPAVSAIREKLIGGSVNHFDETGVRVDGKTVWVHNSSTSELTLQTINEKRGREGIDANGVLPEFNGVAVHDCWASYFGYDGVEHAVCCAHLLRELNGIEEMRHKHRWPGIFKEFLLFMKSLSDKAKELGRSEIDGKILDYCNERYDRIMKLAESECPMPSFDTSVKRRGRKKKGRERSLIDRLITRKKNVCMFLYNFDVPFDNNQAERDVRYVKVKSKVSGQFRNMGEAQKFLDIESYLGTARKNGVSAFKALNEAFDGNCTSIIPQ